VHRAAGIEAEGRAREHIKALCGKRDASVCHPNDIIMNRT
jgi:hypothetical protein